MTKKKAKVTAKQRKGLKKLGIILLFVGLILGSIYVVTQITGSGIDPFDSMKYPASLPAEISVTNARTGAVINTGAYVDIYKDGVLQESLDTGADGIASGTKDYNTGETLEVYIHPANFIPITITYLVPKEFITADYHQVPSVTLEPACNGESVFLADRTLAEKDAASGSAWNCTPTLPYLLAYWKITLDTDDEALGGEWFLPSSTEQYPIQKTYAIIKLTDASGYADGMTIEGWQLSNDGVTWYVELSQVIVYDTTYGNFGIFWIKAYMHFPQTLNLHEVALTAQIISECDPSEMQTGNYAASGLLWDDADNAAVYVGMEA